MSFISCPSFCPLQEKASNAHFQQWKASQLPTPRDACIWNERTQRFIIQPEWFAMIITDKLLSLRLGEISRQSPLGFPLLLSSCAPGQPCGGTSGTAWREKTIAPFDIGDGSVSQEWLFSPSCKFCVFILCLWYFLDMVTMILNFSSLYPSGKRATLQMWNTKLLTHFKPLGWTFSEQISILLYISFQWTHGMAWSRLAMT